MDEFAISMDVAVVDDVVNVDDDDEEEGVGAKAQVNKKALVNLNVSDIDCGCPTTSVMEDIEIVD